MHGVTHQLAGDGGHGDRRAFAVGDEMAIAPVQPLLRAPCLGDGRRRLPVTSTGQRVPYRRSMTIVPGGLDEDAPGVGVPGLGQRGPALPLTRGILRRHQESPPCLTPMFIDRCIMYIGRDRGRNR